MGWTFSFCILLYRSQHRLRPFPRRGEEFVRKFNGDKVPAIPYLGIRDIVDGDVATVEALESEQDIFAVSTPDGIAITTNAVNGIQQRFLLGLAVVQVEVAEAIIADRVVQQEEMIAIPIEAGDFFGAFRVGETEIQAREFIDAGGTGIGTVLKIHKQKEDLIRVGQLGIHDTGGKKAAVI